MKRSRFALAACALVTASQCWAVNPVLAEPTVDELIKDMEAKSHEATTKSEEVKQLALDIENGKAEVERLSHQADAAREAAREASKRAQLIRVDVDRVAQAKYRGASLEHYAGLSSARNPQEAIDRGAYISSLSERNSRIIADLNRSLETVASEHSAAAAAKAAADFRLGELGVQHQRLEREESELREQVKDLEARIDALDPAALRAWLSKNNPIAGVDLASIVGGSESGMAAVNAALSKLGAPYGWGATGPDTFDCSGLMVWSYAQQGKSIPRTSQAQMAGGTPVSRDELQPGDIVGYYPGATHVGMYIGNGQLVHASDYGIPVQVVDVDSMPFYGARRY